MTHFTPPPRKFERSTDDRIIGGVCAGAGRYLNVDPTLVRVVTVVATLFTGVPIVLYIVALLLVPDQQHAGARPAAGAPTPPPPAPGPWPQAPTGSDPVWGSEGAPWEQNQAPDAPPTSPRPAAGDADRPL